VTQELVWVKPVLVVMLPMFTVVVPLLVMETNWVELLLPTNWSANSSEPGDKVAPLPSPVPLSGTRAGPSEVVMVSVSGNAPTSVGANLTLMLQLAPVASELPQVVVKGYWEVSVVIELMLTAEMPPLLKVSDCAVLVCPALRSPNARELGFAVNGAKRNAKTS